MPPRKKARLSSRAASSPSADTPKEATPAISTKAATEATEPERPVLDPDPWTDEQETALFKGIVKWKPVGMHKHFRMLSISNYVKSCGFSEEHTKPEGIWRKLETIYNLKTLDEREDSIGELGYDDSETIEKHVSFKLPKDEYGDMMFERRIEKDSSSSPPTLRHQLSRQADDEDRDTSTVDDTEDPRSSPPGVRSNRSSRRGRGAKSGRGRAAVQDEPTTRGRKKATSPEESEDQHGSEEDEEDDDDDDEEEEEEEEETKPGSSTRGGRGGRGGKTRGRGARARGRGGRGGRGRGR